jgi:hypothetical protein
MHAIRRWEGTSKANKELVRMKDEEEKSWKDVRVWLAEPKTPRLNTEQQFKPPSRPFDTHTTEARTRIKTTPTHLNTSHLITFNYNLF